MSVYALAAGGIIAGTGVVLEGITCAITGIRATKEDNSAQKSQLLAASSTVGFGTILLIISLILLFIYQIKGKAGAGSSKGLGIASLVIGILAICLLITGATIAGIFSQKYKSDLTTANSFKTAGILTAIGLVLIIVGYIVLYMTVLKRLKFKR